MSKEQAANNDRRTLSRHTSRLKKSCHLLRVTEEGPWLATVRNISQEGLGLVADRPFTPGTILTLELPTKGAEERMLRVTHVKALGDGRGWTMGGVFSSPLSNEDLDSMRVRAPAIVKQSERRTAIRHLTRLNKPCRLLRATEVGNWSSTIRNVSADGIGLIARRPFKPGMLVSVELPTRKGKPRQLRVIHARNQDGNSWWILGGAFANELSSAELQALV